jgi:hypothetical protein
MMNFAAGKLANTGCYCFGESLRNKIVKDEEEKRKKAEQTANRRAAQKSKQQETFRTAASKYFAGQQKVLADDIKGLPKHVSKKGDSPIRTKIKDLGEQLHC